jgi:hypothetical protein
MTSLEQIAHALGGGKSLAMKFARLAPTIRQMTAAFVSGFPQQRPMVSWCIHTLGTIGAIAGTT